MARTGRSLVARALRRTLGLPASGRTSAAVEIARVGDGETWTRRFGTGTFRSRLAPTRHLGFFDEFSGPLRLRFDLRSTQTGVVWRLAGWRLGPLPLPFALAPRILARGEARGAAYGFSVVVAHRWLGLVLAYRGSLESGGFKAELRRPPSLRLKLGASLSACEPRDVRSENVVPFRRHPICAAGRRRKRCLARKRPYLRG